jgi:hypothetical protein
VHSWVKRKDLGSVSSLSILNGGINHCRSPADSRRAFFLVFPFREYLSRQETTAIAKFQVLHPPLESAIPSCMDIRASPTLFINEYST